MSLADLGDYADFFNAIICKICKICEREKIYSLEFYKKGKRTSKKK